MARRKKHPRLPNSFGSIRYIGSGRRNPYAVHPPCKETDEFGRMIRPKALCYVDDWYVGFAVLTAYHAGTYKNGDELELRSFRQQSEGRDLDIFCQKIIDNIAASHSAKLRSIKNQKTFTDVYREFFKWKFDSSTGKNLSDASRRSINSAFNNCASLHDKIFSELRYPDLQGCVDACPLKRASKELIVSLFKQMYKYANLYDLCDKDYSLHVSPNSPEDDDHGVPFTEEELRTLWENRTDPTVEMILIMCYSGFRIAAYNSLEINIEDRYFKGGIKTASGKDRTVPIHSAILEMVKKRSKTNAVFLGNTPNNFREKMYDTLKKLNIQKHTPHDCRHTFSALCEKYNVNENDRKRMLGHAFKNDITNAVYGHRTVEDLRIEIEKIQIVV